MKTLREIRDDDYAQFAFNEGCYYIVYTGKLSDFFMKEVISQLRNKTNRDKRKLSKLHQNNMKKLINLRSAVYTSRNNYIPYRISLKRISKNRRYATIREICAEIQEAYDDWLFD